MLHGNLIHAAEEFERRFKPRHRGEVEEFCHFRMRPVEIDLIRDRLKACPDTGDSRLTLIADIDHAERLFGAGVRNCAAADHADIQRRAFVIVGERIDVSNLRRDFCNGAPAAFRIIAHMSADPLHVKPECGDALPFNDD